jgi:hypothetical protein
MQALVRAIVPGPSVNFSATTSLNKSPGVLPIGTPCTRACLGDTCCSRSASPARPASCTCSTRPVLIPRRCSGSRIGLPATSGTSRFEALPFVAVKTLRENGGGQCIESRAHRWPFLALSSPSISVDASARFAGGFPVCPSVRRKACCCAVTGNCAIYCCWKCRPRSCFCRSRSVRGRASQSRTLWA